MNTEMKTTQTELYNRFKSTTTKSIIHLTQHIFYFSLFLYFLIFVKNNIWISAITIPVLALFNIRTFTIFHDCGHQSYFHSFYLNYWVGSIMGIWVLTPVSWSYEHHLHHLTNGNIENKYDFAYNITIYHTKQQFNKFTPMEQYFYSAFRHPLVFFGILPVVKFFILNRFDYFLYKVLNKYPYEKSIYLFTINLLINNLGLMGLLKILYDAGILQHYIVSMYIASVLGTILFHNQHTFNPAYVVSNEEWTLKNSGLDGSSFMIVPSFFKFFTNGIEYHHIHHMNPRIPGYHLADYHNYIMKNEPFLFDDVNYLSIVDCLNNCWLALYDEDTKQYTDLYF
jgi:omega-6 fatty acid desaturase (delta-12 desaturase)